MAYAAISKPGLHFNTKLYTGNGSTQSITGVGFQPDFIWGKNRSATGSHNLCDVVRGATKIIYSNLTDGEATDSNSFTSFDSDGFSIGSQSNINGNGNNIVTWNWKAGGAGSANSDGATASTVSVNNTAGFSIVKWTGTSGNTTVGHGMNTAPVFTIVKNYGGSGMNWIVYHKAISPDYAIKLNTADGQSNSNNYWQSTAPTNSLLTFTGNTASNSNGNNMIGYCFAEKKGFSKFGSYTGNGNTDGTFVYTGFKPALVILKHSNSNGNNWRIIDNKRDPDNVTQKELYPSTNDAEGSADRMDLLSTGFKLRSSGSPVNDGEYIYAAFAEEPLVANVGQSIPATAR